MKHRIPLALAALILSASAASAGPVTLTSLFRQGGIGDSGTPGIPITAVCSDSTSGGTLTDTCSGNLTVASGQIGYFDGLAEAAASTSGGISLGSYSSLDAWRVNPSFGGAYPRYYASTTTTASIEDNVFIAGTGAATSGFLQFTFDVDGSATEYVDPYTLDGFDPTTAGSYSWADGYGYVAVNGTTSSLLQNSTTVVLNVPFTFGSTQLLTLSFLTHASASIVLPEGYRITTDFFNTAVLTGGAILDLNGAVIPGAYLDSTTGFVYPGLTQATPVPEPATLLLVGIGLAGIRRRFTR